MKFIINNMKWVMLVSGVLTFTMIYAAIAPEASQLSTFGETLEGPLSQIIVRNWGALIALIGGMLVYGAFNPATRPLVLTVAGLSKIVFISLVLVFGSHYLDNQVGIAIAIDSVMVLFFIWYLIATRSNIYVKGL
ncbi:MAG TPA: hypothetical protein VLH08_14855 [Acidobacteriota bacterium]|nr:hypothetical protein [Acidobacteriota bacterium]